jgi:anti-sigma regulatory factor (Ser/Thr protein kinase)
VTVPHARTSVAEVRHAFSDQLVERGVVNGDRADAVLVLSELVSNAVKHGLPLPHGEIRVGWRIGDEDLHVEITDGGSSSRPEAGVAAFSAVGGRGLDIVRQVSRRWGVTEGEDAVTVWADIPRSGQAAGGRLPLARESGRG